MIIKRWGSLLMIIALWLSVGIFLKRFDFELFGEAKAFLAILYGWVTSFLFLSFIWLLQKKPIHGSWTGLHTSWPNSGDSPSMHPRGRTDSLGSIEDNQRHSAICTVASLVDRPPNYEDALIYSKPLNWTYIPVDKPINCPSESTSASTNANAPIYTCPCLIHSGAVVDQATSGDCCICMNGLISNKANNKSTTNSVAQLALTIVRGFTSVHPDASNQQTVRSENTQNLRRISYSQLDVSQLISGSPPKYKDLVFEDLGEESLSNNSNEPRAG